MPHTRESQIYTAPADGHVCVIHVSLSALDSSGRIRWADGATTPGEQHADFKVNEQHVQFNGEPDAVARNPPVHRAGTADTLKLLTGFGHCD